MRLARSVPQLDRCEGLERERRLLIQAVEERKAARNAGSQEVARRKRAGEPADDLIAHGRALGEEIARLERELAEAEGQLAAILLEVPNITARRRARRRRVEQRHRAELGRAAPVRRRAAALGDRRRARPVRSRARRRRSAAPASSCFAAQGARLVRALLNFFLDVHSREHGYEEVWPPVLVNRASMTGTGQLPKFEDDAYTIAGDDLFLIPDRRSAGHEPLSRRDPRRRRAAEGVLRVHAVLSPRGGFGGEGHARHPPHAPVRQGRAGALLRARRRPRRSSQLLLGHAESMLQRLGIPYRVKLLAAGDTGFSSAKTYDLEAWAPGVGAWLEVSSVQHLHRLPGAAREHPLPAGEG